jgi:hydrogenase-4 membrane subunit HyfE
MELSNIDILAASAAAAGVWMCGVTNLRTMFWGLAIQTFMLGAAAWLNGAHAEHYLILAGIFVIIKAIAIPAFLSWVAGRIEVQHDKGVSLSPSLSLFCACGALAAGYFLAPYVSSVHGSPGAAGMAVALLAMGMLIMITRRLAISQIIGFLVLENGISLYTLTQEQLASVIHPHPTFCEGVTEAAENTEGAAVHILPKLK